MGIPGLYGRWLAKNNRYIRAIHNGMPHKVSSLAFDLNGVFHEARMKVFAGAEIDVRIKQALNSTDPLLLEAEIHNYVTSIILEMVELANPAECLILAVDGVAPGAKMQQQRARRERTALEREGFVAFDSNAITPGTDFMIRMDLFMKRFIGMYREILPPKIIYSSHLVPGEGEHKIMEYYRQGDVPGKDAHVIHGLDADFIMLSVLSPMKNIFLAREDERGLAGVEIEAIKRYLQNRMKTKTALDDFVIIMMLMGNDFLPHFPAFASMADSIDLLIDLYTQGQYQLSKDGSINWDDLKKYIQVIADQEPSQLTQVSQMNFRYPSRFVNAAMDSGQFDIDRFRSAWYINALGPKGPSDFTDTVTQIIQGYVPTQADVDLYPLANVELDSISEPTADRIESMCINYLQIMAWVYLYYRQGTAAINQGLSYKFHHTPMLVDLAAIVQTVDTVSGFENDPMEPTFTALHQLVSVLPIKSRDLLPKELQPVFEYNSLIRDLFPRSFTIERDGTNRDYQGIPLVPLIDRRRIMDAVAQCSFSKKRAEIWLPHTDEVFQLSPEDLERRTINRQRRTTNRQRGRGQRRNTKIPSMNATYRGRSPQSPRGPQKSRGQNMFLTHRNRGRSPQQPTRRAPSVPQRTTRRTPSVPQRKPSVPQRKPSVPQQTTQRKPSVPQRTTQQTTRRAPSVPQRTTQQTTRRTTQQTTSVPQRTTQQTIQRKAPSVPQQTIQRKAPSVPQRTTRRTPSVPQQTTQQTTRRTPSVPQRTTQQTTRRKAPSILNMLM